MNAKQMIARMARDPRLDKFHQDNGADLVETFLWDLIDQSQQEVSMDLKTPVTESDLSLSSGDREVNLPTDLLILDEARYRKSTDDTAFEGYLIRIVNSEDLY